MKIRALPLLMILSGGLALQPAHAAAVSISAGIQINAVGDFYQPLEPYGTWVNVSSYGRCFHPTQIAADWRPYSLGHWEYTDVGWYWQSDEPFGWACFHYGSWVDDPQYGWVWIPGMEWSPAWVVWRESDNYIGWAPCGPNLTVAAPSLFVFVQAGHFCDPIRPNTVIVNNRTIINNTRVVNNFRSERHSFDGRERAMRVNAGPDVARVQRVTGRHFTPTPVATVYEQSRSRAHYRGETQQPEREHSITTPQRQNEERVTPEQSREHSVTTPERRSVQEPSGAQHERRQDVTPREQPPLPPSPRREAPKTERPPVREPSGATREEHRQVTPQPAQRNERAQSAPVEHAPARAELHAAPQAEHAAPFPEDRGNGRDRHDQQ